MKKNATRLAKLEERLVGSKSDIFRLCDFEILERIEGLEFQKARTPTQKFKNMRNILIVQEQTTEAILIKNLAYVEKELKSLQAIDYKKFEEAERWLKNAKVKLDNFEQNNNNSNYIAFDMLEGAK